MASVQDLVVKARLDTAELKSGVATVQRELQKLQKTSEGLRTASPKVDTAANRSLQEYERLNQQAARAVTERATAEVAANQATLQTVAAVNELKTATAGLSSTAAAGSVTQLATATTALGVAVDQASPEPQIRNWQDWANAVRSASAQAQAAATVERQLTQATQEQGRALITVQQQFAAQDAAMRRFHGLTDQAIAKQRELAAVQASTSRQGVASATALAGSMTAVAGAGRGAGAGIQSLRGPLTTLTAQLAGVNPALSSVISVLGAFAVGSTAMAGALFGLAALAGAYQVLTRDAREAKKAQDEALERLAELGRQRQVEERGGQVAVDIDEAEARIAAIREELVRQREAFATLPLAPIADKIRELEDELSATIGKRLEGLRQIEAVEQSAADSVLERAEDMVRLAEQRLRLTGLEGDAARRLSIELDAENKLIEAGRDLEGQQLAIMKQAISDERQLLLRAVEREAAYRRQREELERQTKALEELDKILRGIEFPKLAIPRRAGELNLTPVPVRSTPQSRAGAPPPELDSLRDTLEAVKLVTDGFGRLADALGDTDQALSSALRGVDSFINGLAQIDAGRAQGGAIGALGQFSGFLALTAGAIEFANAMLSRSALEREHDSILERNNERLSELRLALERFRITPDNTLTARDAALAAANNRNLIAELVTSGGFQGTTPIPNIDERLLEDFLRPFGFSLEQFAAIARQAGIDLFDSTGNVVIPAFQQLADALNLGIQAITGFERSLEGLQEERDIRDAILGIERDAQQQLSALFSDLTDLAPDLFQQFFAGIDLTDIEAVRKQLLAAFDAFAGNAEGFAALMGDLTREEFLQWITESANSLKGLDEAARDFTTTLRGVPEVFNFTLASLRAAGTREYTPPGTTGGPSRFPGGDPRTPSQDNSLTIGSLTIEQTASGDLAADIAAGMVVALSRMSPQAKPLTVTELMPLIKAELDRRAQSKGQGTRELALNWPG
jgi:hypothetical protein